MSGDNRGWTFSLKEVLLQIIDLYFAHKQLNDGFGSYKHTAFGFTGC